MGVAVVAVIMRHVAGLAVTAAVPEVTEREHDATQDGEHGADHRRVVFDEKPREEEPETGEEPGDDAPRVLSPDRMDDRDPRHQPGDHEEADLEGLVVEEADAHRRREGEEDGHEGAVHGTGEADDGTHAIRPTGHAPFRGGVGVSAVGVVGVSVHFQGGSWGEAGPERGGP